MILEAHHAINLRKQIKDVFKRVKNLLPSGKGYVPVKSKLEHPPPGQPPRAFEFLENFCSNATSPDRKAVQMPKPPGNYQISVAYIMLLGCAC